MNTKIILTSWLGIVVSFTLLITATLELTSSVIGIVMICFSLISLLCNLVVYQMIIFSKASWVISWNKTDKIITGTFILAPIILVKIWWKL